MTTDRTFVYASSASGPYSRPKPDCLTPPNGTAGSSIAQSLTQTMPASSLPATRCARVRSLVCSPAASPYAVELASATASSSSANDCTVRTGPKTSSLTTRESSGSPVITVGA